MKIKGFERYTIPLTRAASPSVHENGITVEQLIAALKQLPKEAHVSIDWSGGNSLFATINKPDIFGLPYVPGPK